MPQKQRGAALLMALIIVTVISTLAVSMIWQQWRAVQVEAAERGRQQSAWILTGALAWSRIILKEDARSNNPEKTDNLGEPWAVPLAEARLSTFLAADKENTDDAPEAFLSGQITDAQSRFNLSNLVETSENAPPQYSIKHKLAFERLCGHLNLSVTVAQQISKGMLDSTPPYVNAANPPLKPESLNQLTWFGVDEKTIKRLEPYVVILPTNPTNPTNAATLVNVNTASREVIAAVTGADLATAESLVQMRQRTHFKSQDDAATQLPRGNDKINASMLDIKSDFFIVSGKLRLNNQVLEQRSLVQRRFPKERDVTSRSREWVNSTEPG